MQPAIPVGIVGYGAYVPRYRIKASEIARVWGAGDGGLPVEEKAVPGLDEDVISMSIEAARNALLRAQIDPQDLGAVWVGSESHPYAVKPSSTVVAEALGATPLVSAGDWQFACKAGTEAMQAAMGFVGSGMARYALCVGMDTAQGRPGDALEYTADLAETKLADMPSGEMRRKWIRPTADMLFTDDLRAAIQDRYASGVALHESALPEFGEEQVSVLRSVLKRSPL